MVPTPRQRSSRCRYRRSSLHLRLLLPPFSERYTQIIAGEMVGRSVTVDDPPCAEYPEFRCQYFRITPPSDGRLDVAMTVHARSRSATAGPLHEGFSTGVGGVVAPHKRFK